MFSLDIPVETFQDTVQETSTLKSHFGTGRSFIYLHMSFQFHTAFANVWITITL